VGKAKIMYNNRLMKKELLEICEKFLLVGHVDIIIPEPYIPYIPDNWNKVLILAECQNLSESNKHYVDRLNRCSRKQRFERLYLNEESLGVSPWDDGSLKIAIEAALKLHSLETAVSNAVLWSRTEANKNLNPENVLIQNSAKLWKKFLDVIQPELIVVAGKIAQKVISISGWQEQVIKLRLPSPNALSRISGMFETADLLERYPEVKEVIQKNPTWINKNKKNKIFYGCHAVSMIKKPSP
jgi:hypothetical protein